MVQEIPAELLAATSTDAREALMALWRPIFKQRTPVVVVPLDLIALAEMPADEIRELAQLVRGSVQSKPVIALPEPPTGAFLNYRIERINHSLVAHMLLWRLSIPARAR